MRTFFSKLWTKPVVREGVLLIVSSVAVTLTLQLGDLLRILETDPDPLTGIGPWFEGAWTAVLLTAIKQAVVYLILKLGNIK
jgi:hypothetical protein